MKWHEIFREAVVGGLSGLSVVLIYILIRAHLDGADPGDWLQFAGAMLGSGTAVGGALFIERVKSREEKSRGDATLRDAFEETARAMRPLAQPLEGGLKAKVSQINAHRFHLEVAKDFSEFVLVQHIRPDSRAWRQLRVLGNLIDRILKLEWAEFDQAAGEQICTEKTIEAWEKKAKRVADATLSVIERQVGTMDSPVHKENK